mmetsp:Transcript_27182/g.48463  ORF Transcript_27182/g.48463 Transcript_27182/m.48463 type:complete len:280 (+) Transcript_27182:957-1796(+)
MVVLDVKDWGLPNMEVSLLRTGLQVLAAQALKVEAVELRIRICNRQDRRSAASIPEPPCHIFICCLLSLDVRSVQRSFLISDVHVQVEVVQQPGKGKCGIACLARSVVRQVGRMEACLYLAQLSLEGCLQRLCLLSAAILARLHGQQDADVLRHGALNYRADGHGHHLDVLLILWQDDPVRHGANWGLGAFFHLCNRSLNFLALCLALVVATDPEETFSAIRDNVDGVRENQHRRQDGETGPNLLRILESDHHQHQWDAKDEEAWEGPAKAAPAEVEPL